MNNVDDYPTGRCNGCMREVELVLEEHRPDPEKPNGPWMVLQWCQRCCNGDGLKQHLSEELNRAESRRARGE